MPFQEIHPLRRPKDAGTGVRVTLADFGGLVVTVRGDAMQRLIGGGKVKALLDADPAYPRLRLIAADDGPFDLKLPIGLRSKSGEPPTSRVIRIGHRPEFGEERFKALDCIWEAVEGMPAIDIELPREMRVTSSVNKLVTQPSNSSTAGKSTNVTLAGRAREPV